MPAARPREPELTQRMGCFRRGLVLLFALGFVAAALVIGGAAVQHGLAKGKQDDIYAGLFLGGLLLVPGLILGFIGLRGRYRVGDPHRSGTLAGASRLEQHHRPHPRARPCAGAHARVRLRRARREVDRFFARDAPHRAALCAWAAETEAGVVVMPSFDRSAAHTRTMGSVTEWMVRNAPCPVLVHDVPESKAPRHGDSLAEDWLNDGERLG
ncbi:MAG: Universal stress protein family [Pseudomonadota bacterium]